MITGSCHCGVVRFEVRGQIRGFMHCHCQTCRKLHGTVYGSSARVASDDFYLVSGDEALTRYESSPGKQRCFCRHCGAHVFAVRLDSPEWVVLRMGALDGDPGVRPEAHIWVSDKAPWYEIHDDLPRFQGKPERR